jgi:selenocysteine-specific elongation factor
MLIGTAGHIDHGKTALIRRLTGRNTDRLPEEIKRGISIELGYAYVPLDDAAMLGFVDVPGHEKFVHTMVAGATGIDFALLVVAADDGVMPQTEEHLDILRLLGIEQGAIALTKIDAVPPVRVSEAQEELSRWLAGSAQAAWPVFALSSISGEGIDALDQFLREHALRRQQRATCGHFRLAVDRVFTLGGIGTVVTGAVHAGRVHIGDEVQVQPDGPCARVRSIHAQDRVAEVGVAGERCALNLAGIAKDQVERGAWVQAAALANLSYRFDATLHLSSREAKALVQGELHLHHGARDVLARVTVLDAPRIEPGTTQLVAIALNAPLPLCKGDRFVLRDASARRTLGGGQVLDIAPPARGRRLPQRLALLNALRDQPPIEALQAWLACEAVPLARLAAGWNLRDDELTDLLQQAGARIAANIAFSATRWDALRTATLAAVEAAHQREPEAPGIEQNRLRRIVAPALAADAFADVVDELLREGLLARRGAFVAAPSHKAELARDERLRWERIKPLLMESRYNPPRVRDIARELKLPEAEVRALLRRVARMGEVSLVATDHFFLTDAVRDMADMVGELLAVHGVARAAEFRDRIGTGRKVAILILEFFDRVGYTRRVRDDHVARRDNPWRIVQESEPSS